MKHEVIVQNNKLLLSTSGLCDFFNVKAPTITGWTKKWLKNEIVPGEKKKYYDLLNAIALKQMHLNDKHSKTKNSEEPNPNEILLPDGRTLSQIDITNQQDLEMVTYHPYGERFLDILKLAEEVSRKKHELGVRKKQYIETHELDQLLSEFLAQIKNKLISIRSQLPIEQVDKIIEAGYSKQNSKEAMQKILSDTADKDFLEMFEDIKKTMFGRTPESKIKTIDFLQDLIKKVSS